MSIKKQISLVLLMATGSAVAFGQKAVIKGNIKGLNEPSVMFSYMAKDSSRMDTVPVTRGKFLWKTKFDEPTKVYIFFPTFVASFFAENSAIKIEGQADSLQALKINGSKTQDEAKAFDKTLQDIEDQEMPLYQKWGKGTKEEQAALEATLDNLRKERRARQDAYITTHPNSFFSASLVTDRAVMGDYEDVKKVYDLLDPAMQQTDAGNAIAKRLSIIERSRIGEPVLDFSQKNTEGQTVRMADFKGKYVFVDFWASWCGPCRGENPNVLQAYNKYKDKNFTVIGVSLDDNGDKWKKAIKEDNMPWSQLSDLKGWKNEVSTYYGIQGIPSSLLVDPQGRIIAKNLRGEALNKKLAELFGG